MAIAFVLINAELGAETELVNQLKAIEHVKYVYVLYGEIGRASCRERV